MFILTHRLCSTIECHYKYGIIKINKHLHLHYVKIDMKPVDNHIIFVYTRHNGSRVHHWQNVALKKREQWLHRQ